MMWQTSTTEKDNARIEQQLKSRKVEDLET